MVCLLTLTSNPGSANFQRLLFNGKPLYRQIVEQSLLWADKNQLGYIIGATHSSELEEMRTLLPDRVFLIPGIGTQGGNVESTIKANANGPAIINISRSIIFASKEKDFAEKAREKAYKFKLSFM
jgi:orotidine-5'-phosphate decarboxylase